MNSQTIFQRLGNFFFRRNRQPSLVGSQYPMSIGSTTRKSSILEVPIRPIRPVAGSIDYSFELMEIATWSYESRHAISIIARDCFQQLEGRVDSWSIAPQIDDDGNEIPLNPDIRVIGNELKNRYCGKTPVIGGNRLERAAREMLLFGDCFLELGIEKDGSDWAIANSLYLPTFSTFAEEDLHGNINGYWQRRAIRPSNDDIWMHPAKVLHFCYEENQIYGTSINLQNLETWRKIKEVSADLEEAARAVGVSPWLHIMPPDKDENYKQAYQREHQALLEDGIIANLYLLPGSDVKKASTGDTSLDALIDYWLNLRKQMLPPGMPIWLFPGLANDEKGAQDLQGQPALAYTRMIAYIRSLLGEQIKWAINLELVLKKGYDWLVENGAYDIVWGEWQTSTLEVALDRTEDNKEPTNQPDDQTDVERFISGLSLNGFYK